MGISDIRTIPNTDLAERQAMTDLDSAGSRGIQARVRLLEITLRRRLLVLPEGQLRDDVLTALRPAWIDGGR